LLKPSQSDCFARAFVMGGWLISIIMLGILPLRRSPQAATSWLLLIFLWPVPGLILFLAIGRARGSRSRRERFLKLAPFLAETAAGIAQAGPLTPDRAPMPAKPCRKTRRLSGSWRQRFGVSG